MQRFHSCNPMWQWFWGFVGITILSAISFRIDWLHTSLFLVITLVTFVVALYRLEWGVLLLAAELLIGSKGHLFWYDIAYDLSWGRVSIRMALFVAVMLAWGIDRIRKKQWPGLISHSSFRYVLPFFVVLLFAVGNGIWIKGYPIGRVIADANNWFYIALVFPLFDVVHSKTFFKRVFTIVKAAIAFLITKAALFFIVFSLAIPGLTSLLYHFERQTGGGQIAPAASGMWRIYFWSELFLLPALLILMGYVYARLNGPIKKTSQTVTLMGVVVFGIILTLFRSFWVGALAGICVWLLLMVIGQSKIKFKWRGAQVVVLWVIISSVISVYAIQGIGSSLSALSGERPAVQKELFTTGEPGVQNRINQFMPLLTQIQQQPILGSGFGTAITYESTDVRNQGIISTTALEFGWLDMAVEIGLLGVVLFLVWLGYIVVMMWQNLPKQSDRVYLDFGLIAGIFAIMATHAISPFMNHPLGIGFVIFLFVYAIRHSHHFSRTR